MHATNVRRAVLALLLPAVFVACDSLSELSDLDVVNENNPDAERIFREAQNVENIIGGSFQAYSFAAVWFLPFVMSSGADEYTVSWGNFGLQNFSSEPRVAWNNSSAYTYASTTESAWGGAYEALSGAYDGIKAIEEDPALADVIDAPRALAFAKLVQGLAHGWLALSFDSAFIFDERVDLETDTLLLQPYPNVFQAAMGYLDDAAGASFSDNLPASWINGNSDIDDEKFVRIANSFAARLLIDIARTPAEAQSNDFWAEIITRVDAGLTAADGDFGYLGDGAELWFHAPLWYSNCCASWARADYKTIGYTEFGDGKGYDNWLATPVGQRTYFELDIPDRRITNGPPPHAPQVDGGLDFTRWPNTSMDPQRGTYHFSWYGATRYAEYRASSGLTYVPIISHRELQLYKAEAMMELGQAGVAAIINNTRVPRGQLTAATDADADLAEKLYYETQIETFGYCPGCAYFNRRRWGPLSTTDTHYFGLLVGTQRHFAPPGEELEILQKLTYSYGGPGAEGEPLTESSEPFCKGPGCGGASAPAGAAPFNGSVTASMVPAKTLVTHIREHRGDDPAMPRGIAALSRYH